jgi:cobalt transporter subunit CbtA
MVPKPIVLSYFNLGDYVKSNYIMTFRNIVFSAVMVGIIVGSLYGLFQQFQINPIIYASEAYEVSEANVEIAVQADANDNTEAAHSHDHGDGTGWSPADGFERTTATLVANIVTAITFSLFMISVMSFHNLKSNKPKLNWKTGLLWGAALMLSIFVAPSLLGLQPEIPGTLSESLGQRQVWWISSTVATALGLLLLYYGATAFKIAGGILLVLPQVLGAPTPQTHSYANTDPVAVEALNQLSGQFVTMTTIGMTIFCLLIGALCGFASTRFVRFDRA